MSRAEQNAIVGTVKERDMITQSNWTARLVPVGALMVIVSGGLLVAIPLLRQALLIAASEEAAGAMAWVGLYVTMVVALFLVPIGMVGFHALQMHNYGRIGHGGFWTVVMASAVLALGLACFLWVNPALLWLASPVGTAGLLAGFCLYGSIWTTELKSSSESLAIRWNV